ncbi:F0F1 ATP synthase subunit delta [Nitratifractor sp.]|uniref:F0F1 ATP synthase subunit delta n=1 Tax=Nitratifractor sp. TaxID=2268144 RepID=UPI0025F82E0F|nr:F0F1 ATP synthase subunit delta [Nitratifractor sp.]
MNELIAKRYAKALQELIPEKELPAQLQVLRQLEDSLNDPKAKELVRSPLVRGDEKFRLLVEPLKKKVDPRLYRLLEIMSEKGRLDLVPALNAILDYEIKRLKNRFEGTVEADSKLPKEKVAELESLLGDYSGAKIKLKQTGDKTDGLKVEVEDLGLELNVSKSRLKAELLDFIQRAL